MKRSFEVAAMHEFFHMSIGAGLSITTITVCFLVLFKMMLELLVDIIESTKDE